MKKQTYKYLFRLFSYLTDKTNGMPMLVKYKIALGTILIGISSCSYNVDNKSTNSATSGIGFRLNLIPDDDVVMCYVPTTIPVEFKVVDDSDNPLSNMVISVKNDNSPRTLTFNPKNSKYKIDADITDTLVLSKRGYKTREVSVASMNENNVIKLNTDSFVDNESLFITCYDISVEPDLN